MSGYREIAPAPRLQDSVECFWSSPGSAGGRVLPDGCADIVLRRSGGTAELNLVGAMTGYRDFPYASGELFFGVRFRPGRWAERFRVPADVVTDRIDPLDAFWGSQGRELLQRLASADSDAGRAAILDTALAPQLPARPIQRAIRWMEQRHGCVSLDQVADQCGLSARQFRRVCLAETGLTPKFLARVLRFRYALSRAGGRAGADLALDCGYYDQAHLINEFRAFSGRTPAEYGA